MEARPPSRFTARSCIPPDAPPARLPPRIPLLFLSAPLINPFLREEWARDARVRVNVHTPISPRRPSHINPILITLLFCPPRLRAAPSPALAGRAVVTDYLRRSSARHMCRHDKCPVSQRAASHSPVTFGWHCLRCAPGAFAGLAPRGDARGTCSSACWRVHITVITIAPVIGLPGLVNGG